MKPIVQLFTPIFFVMVGLSLNLREIDWSSPLIWLFSLSLLIAAVAGKLFGALLPPFVREILHQPAACHHRVTCLSEVSLKFSMPATDFKRDSMFILGDLIPQLQVEFSNTPLGRKRSVWFAYTLLAVVVPFTSSIASNLLRSL